jgi:hypothetical protein
MDGAIIIIWVLSLACTAVAGFVVGDTIGEKPAAKAEERAIEAEMRAAEAKMRAIEAEERAIEAERRATEAEERATEAEEQEAERINCETCRGGFGNCMVCTMEGYFTGWAPAVKTRREEDNAK